MGELITGFFKSLEEAVILDAALVELTDVSPLPDNVRNINKRPSEDPESPPVDELRFYSEFPWAPEEDEVDDTPMGSALRDNYLHACILSQVSKDKDTMAAEKMIGVEMYEIIERAGAENIIKNMKDFYGLNDQEFADVRSIIKASILSWLDEEKEAKGTGRIER